MPLPGTRLFHRGFEPWGRKVADRQGTAHGRIYDTAFRLIYDGPLRVQQAGDGSLLPIVADQHLTAANFAVVVPAADGLTVTAGHLVEIVDCPGDSELVGKQLVVLGTMHGSIRFQQTLACNLHDQPAL
ncbi:DUF6093 family protein [Micromonospora sp. WMMD737]|uniref:DUF6093 family protein n=1 Tax=Micromonospora sp. WMMD737 TaxID=3404113 RepID=UPI003B929ACF